MSLLFAFLFAVAVQITAHYAIKGIDLLYEIARR